MKYLASYCLLSLAGKQNINENDLLNVLKEIGSEGKQETASLVCKQLAGKCIVELCKEGQSKISSISVCTGAAAPVASSTGGKVETKVEEKQKTIEEEENVDIGDLFG